MLAWLVLRYRGRLPSPHMSGHTTWRRAREARYCRICSTISATIAATASRAVELIIAAQKGEERPAELTVISADLVERGSVAPPPASIR